VVFHLLLFVRIAGSRGDWHTGMRGISISAIVMQLENQSFQCTPLIKNTRFILKNSGGQITGML
jgi:hypothetical protein